MNHVVPLIPPSPGTPPIGISVVPCAVGVVLSIVPFGVVPLVPYSPDTGIVPFGVVPLVPSNDTRLLGTTGIVPISSGRVHPF